MVNWGHSLHFTMRVCMYIISITALNMSLTALTRIISKILRYPLFYGDSNYEIFRSIRNARFDFLEPEWTSISDLAKISTIICCFQVNSSSQYLSINFFIG